jgi:hypothetical protein
MTSTEFYGIFKTFITSYRVRAFASLVVPMSHSGAGE